MVRKFMKCALIVGSATWMSDVNHRAVNNIFCFGEKRMIRLR